MSNLHFPSSARAQQGRLKNASVELSGLSRPRLDVMFGLHGVQNALG